MSSTVIRLLTVLLPLITILLVSSPIYDQVTIFPGTDLPVIEIQHQNQSTPDEPAQQLRTDSWVVQQGAVHPTQIGRLFNGER